MGDKDDQLKVSRTIVVEGGWLKRAIRLKDTKAIDGVDFMHCAKRDRIIRQISRVFLYLRSSLTTTYKLTKVVFSILSLL